MNDAHGMMFNDVTCFDCQLFFILSSIWLHHYYYVFGFLLLVFLILGVTCSEICIVMCYFQLCSEVSQVATRLCAIRACMIHSCAQDYHWWWRSFFTAGSSAVYMFAYSIFYFYTKLEITKFVSTLLYFGYMWILSFSFFVLTGTIGFGACFVFTYHIYGAIKVYILTVSSYCKLNCVM